MEVDCIAYIQSEHNISDVITKIKQNSILIRTVRTSKLDNSVGKWIVRGTFMDKRILKIRECQNVALYTNKRFLVG